MSENPYAAPITDSPVPDEFSRDEAAGIRASRLTREVILRTVSVLFFLKAASTLTQIPFYVNLFAEHGSAAPLRSSAVYYYVGKSAVISLLCALAGWGLWRFRRWAWVLSLAFFAVGILCTLSEIVLVVFYSALLFILLLPKTRALFSENHRLVMRCSPEMKYGAKRVISVVAALLALMSLSGLLM